MPRRGRRGPFATGSSRLARACAPRSGPAAPASFQDERALGAERPRQLVEALQAETFEELPCRPVQDGATGGLFATPLLDEPPRRERVEGLVAVHAADGFDLGSRHRLPVGD